MKYPDTVHIAGFQFRVTEEPNSDFRLAGEISHQKQRIRISTDLAPDETRETLLHEVLHGVDHAIGTKLSERKVAVLSRALYATLRENPVLVAYLMHSGENEEAA